MITRLLTDPRGFIARQSKYPGIKTQSTIAVLVGLMFAIQNIGNTFLLDDAFEYVSGPVWVLALVDLMIPFMLWGVVTVAIYFIARLFGGYFPPGLLFRLTGWGLFPLIGAGLIQSIGRLYALADAAPPEEPSFSAFQYELESYQEYMDAALGEPVFMLATALAVPFVLFSGYIWALVVNEISDVSMREALYVSVVPTLITLLWVLQPFVL